MDTQTGITLTEKVITLQREQGFTTVGRSNTFLFQGAAGREDLDDDGDDGGDGDGDVWLCSRGPRSGRIGTQIRLSDPAGVPPRWRVRLRMARVKPGRNLTQPDMIRLVCNARAAS